ncbi:ArsI/CadI family heavy metal resistance metalloenzyme [Dyella flagellata]|uniref:Glyoxalase n=1 Tax=Dyella flagellata TaxID=1867833 RepID=A0ABQ5XH53_9GAMM|nr:ArsI/CadI family heavy metal resistance metalloenzyme [Dyella flagellata]GLQ90978.1 glyoxalase [Dyella flagellata]
MKRFHVHVNVENLESSIRFYNMLFGAKPSVVKSDYAKWMLEDPRINFAISQRSSAIGIDHLGLQADDENELSAIGERLQSADAVALAEKGATCCYAHSDKYWAEDPQGVRWESFFTHGEATTYSSAPKESEGGSCCGPAMNSKTSKTTCGANSGCC